jgi:hypothetical protein
MTQQIIPQRFASGLPRLLLRVEGLVVMCLCLFAYAHFDLSWFHFAVFFLVPDLFMLGYLWNSRVGATIYNTGHTYIVPAILLLLAWQLDQQALLSTALIWLAHIGFDRALGYGLKYQTSFQHTHLNWR